MVCNCVFVCLLIEIFIFTALFYMLDLAPYIPWTVDTLFPFSFFFFCTYCLFSTLERTVLFSNLNRSAGVGEICHTVDGKY